MLNCKQTNKKTRTKTKKTKQTYKQTKQKTNQTKTKKKRQGKIHRILTNVTGKFAH